MSETKTPWGLYVSLAVNLLLIGGVVGVVLAGARLHRPAPGVGMPGPRAFMGAIPPDKALRIRGQLEGVWRASATERAAARDARIALMQELQKDTFDETKVRAAFAAMRGADAALTAKNQDALVSVLKDLPPQQRMAALAGMMRPRGFGSRGGGGFRPNGPPAPPDAPPQPDGAPASP